VIEFDWDDANISHIALHGITVDEVESTLNGFTIELETQDWHDEKRFSEIGVTSAGRYLVVLTTMRGRRTRPVTAFDAPDHLIRAYVKKR
jgi:uncharacterized DUF497 family protein